MKSLHSRFLCAAAVALALAAPHAQAATVLWTGASSSLWNTSAANWSGNTTIYTSGDIVQFGDTGGANLGISINPAVTPASVTFTDTGAGTNAYTFSTSAINGSGTTVTLDSGFGGSAQFNVSNGYTGATTINGGKLIYNTGVTTASASHSIASGATLELNGSRTNTANTIFSGAGTISKTGTGTTAWGSGAATFALGAGSLIDVQGGTFQGGYGANEVWTNNLSDLNVASGAIFLGAEASVRVNKITGNGTIQTKYGVSGSITVGVDNGSSQFDGIIANGSGQTAGVLTKEGNGTITLTGSNTYNGTTNIRNGTIILVGDNRLATAGAMVLGNTTTSGKLVLGNGTALSQTLAGLTTTGLGGAVVGGASANSTLTLNIATGTNTFGGKLGGNGTNENNLSLIKSGAGNLTLTAANTYIGGTTLNEGILTVGNASSLGTGMVTLNGGTFRNSASFTMANAINVTGTTAMYAGAANFNLSGSVTGNGTINTGGSLGGASSLVFANTDLSGFTGTITHANVTNVNNTAFSAALNTTAKFSTTGATTLGSRYLQFAGGTIGELSGTGGVVKLDGTLNVNQSTNTTYAGVIYNSGGLQKSGNGTLTLSNTNTYTGATAVNAGTLTLNGGSAIPDTGAVTVSSGGVLNLGASETVGSIAGAGNITLGSYTLTSGAANSNTALSGIISGTGGMTKNGTGTLTLSGANTYTGSTTINAGTLALGSNQNLGTISGAGNISLGSYTLTTNATSNTTLSGVISGTGVLTKNGTGTLTLSGANTYVGATTISAGTLTVSGGSAISDSSAVSVSSGAVFNLGASETVGSIAGAGNIALGSNTLTAGGANSNTTVSGVISGTGALTKSGTGALTLSGENTYSGATTVSGGTLAVSGNLSSSALTINTGAVISAGTAAAAAKFNTSSLTFNGGGGYNFTIGNVNASVAGVDYDQITASGALTLNNTAASPFTIYLNGTPTGWSNGGSYSWDIISASSQTGFSSGNFSLNFNNFGIASGDRTGLWALTNPSGGTITLSYTATNQSTWSGTTGNWSSGFSPALVTDLSTAFTGAGGTATNDIASGTLSSIAGITFDASAGAYTLSANAGSAGASGGTALIVKGDISNNSANAQTINMAVAFGSSSTGVINATAGNITISGAISGTGSLSKAGNSTLTLSGANTYSGATTISAGTLTLNGGSAISDTGAVSVSSGAVLNLGASETVGSIAGAGNIALGSYTLTSGGANSSTTVSGVISGTGGMTKNGTGTLTLSGANTYTGSTTINAGTLALGSNQNLGTISGAGNISLGSYTLTTNATSNTTLSGVISGTGVLTKNGTGTLTLAGSNTYSGVTTVSNGKLIYNNGVTTASSAHSIASGATLELNGARTNTANTIFSGAGTLSKTGTGTTVWSTGAATFALGAESLIDVQAGTFTGGSNANEVWTTNLSDLNVASGAVFDGSEANVRVNKITGNGTIKTGWTTLGSITLGVDNGSSQFDGVIANSSAAGSIVKTGSGTITLTGANTNTGTTTIGNGKIILGGGDNRLATAAKVVLGATGTSGKLVLGNGTALSQTLAGLTITGLGGAVVGGASANSTLTLNIATGTNTFGGNLGGNGTNENNLSLIKSGAGALTLSAANTYSGGTTLNTGTVIIGNSAGAGSGTITQADATSLLKFDTTGTIANAMSIYNVSANKTVTLSGGITVNNAVFDVASGETLTISNTINGTGGVTKNGTGTLVLSGNNTYSAPTVINTGTLQAATTGALANTSNIDLNGGSFLVTAENAVNDSAAINLNGGRIAVSGNFDETVGLLTLSANSTIDFSGFGGTLRFGGIGSWAPDATLAIWNWSGTPQYGPPVNDYTNPSNLVFTDNSNLASNLANISFYSDSGSSFVGNGFEQGFSPGVGTEIIAVPETETYFYAVALLAGIVIQYLRRRARRKSLQNHHPEFATRAIAHQRDLLPG